MKGIGHFFHDIKFDGKIENEEVLNLNKEIRDLEDDIRRKLARIKAIQDDCDHTFHLINESAGYDDPYCCPKCGKETEN